MKYHQPQMLSKIRKDITFGKDKAQINNNSLTSLRLLPSAAVFGASPRVFRAFMCNFACVKALVTRNKKDFKASTIAVLTPSEYFAQID